MTARTTRLVFLMVLVATLLLAVSSAFASTPPPSEANPSNMPGPPHSWGGSHAREPGPCEDVAKGGKPHAIVNTYTLNLTISDMPVYYQSVGDAIPFVVYYNSQKMPWSGVLKPMGRRYWTHSYNIYVIPDPDVGAHVVEGNGWVHWYTYNASDGSYTAPKGVFDTLSSDGAGGWVLSRPDGHKLYFLSPLNISGTLVGRLDRIEDKDGLTWHLTYVVEGGSNQYTRLTTITDPLNRQTTLTYTFYGWSSTPYVLTRVTVPGGAHADWTYDTRTDVDCVGFGPTAVTDAAGDTYAFGKHYWYNYLYQLDCYVNSLTDPGGRQVDYSCSGAGDAEFGYAVQSTKIEGLDSSTVAYGTTPSGGTDRWVNITEIKDGNPRVTRHVYSSDQTTSLFGQLLTVIADQGTSPHLNLTQDWRYDSQMRLLRYRDSLQPETGGKAHRHFFYYDDADNPSLVTKYIDPQNSDANPSGSGFPSADCPGWKFEYDNNGDGSHLGRLTKVIHPEDPPNRYTTLSYVSGTSRLSSITVHDISYSGGDASHTTAFEYWDATKGYQLKKVTDPRSKITNLDYGTSTGYLVSVTPPVGGAWGFGSDADGDITSVTDGNGNATGYQYDGIHRLTQITYPSVGNGARTKTFSWTCCGLDQVTDENGITTKSVYDTQTHRLTEVHEDYYGLNYLTQYGYDEVGNLKTVTNARAKVTTYWYDGADRMYQADYPDSTHESWTYRDDDRVLTHTDARGRQTTYRYDADDRLWGPAGSGYVAISYPTDPDVNISRDADGLVTSFADASGTTSLSYYPSTLVKDVLNGYGKKVEYEYDLAGNVSKLFALRTGNPSTEKVFLYTYNDRERVQGITTPQPESASIGFTYDNGGRLSTITRPGSYVTQYYNARNWITDVHNDTSGGACLYRADYLYSDGGLWDHTGNPLKKVEDFAGSVFTTTHRYDHVYRLTEDTRRNSGGGMDWTITYGYDQVGNRTSRVKDGTTVTYTYDDNDKLTAASGGGQTANFFYNEPHPSGPVGGNITKVTGSMLGTWTLSYNDENRPTSISYPGGTETFLYNALGQRMRVVLNGAARRYFYNGERVLEETNDTNGTQVRYTSAGSSYYEPLVHFKRADGSIRLPLMDGVGTVRRLVDQNAGVTDLYSLDAFGRYLGGGANPTPNPYRFGGAWGYITDTPGSGLLQVGARYYWPEVGRFIQQDPVGDGANWYAYVDSNPLIDADPEGLRIRVRGDRRAVDSALRYIQRDPTLRRIIGDLRSCPTTYTIVTNGQDIDDYTLGTRTVRWDPHSALRTTGRGRQTPALGLGHELAHAYEPAARFRQLNATPDPDYGTAEERRVIANIETPAARCLGESIRHDHGGTPYRVRNPRTR